VPELAAKRMPNQKLKRNDKYNVVLSWRSKGTKQQEAQREQSAVIVQKVARGMVARWEARERRDQLASDQLASVQRQITRVPPCLAPSPSESC
jgi:hypothetical protein